LRDLGEIAGADATFAALSASDLGKSELSVSRAIETALNKLDIFAFIRVHRRPYSHVFECSPQALFGMTVAIFLGLPDG
jgi:hypothetical protein